MQKITLAKIISRLTNRFQLREHVPEDFMLSETVIPVTNVDELIRTVEMKTATIAISANGTYTGLTIPVGKRWIIRGVQAGRLTGTYTLQNLFIINSTTSVDRQYGIILNNTATTDEIFSWNGNGAKLDSGWRIAFQISGYSGAGNTLVNAIVEEEDAY